ncbi:DUF6368 family protein [Herbidospora daliensis]|uniref:DUF6368 family protein n=1 Tax=Herbidospora daliensis TaxID=295585 RepID=UPI000B192FE2|nr:DUF6368 family protein [Herbidospora daliensis]
MAAGLTLWLFAPPALTEPPPGVHMEVGPWEPDPGDDYSQVPRVPVAELMMWSEDEARLGRAALDLARRLDALVDFDGLLGPRPWVSDGAPGDFRRRMLAVRPFVASIGGVVHEVGYAMHGGDIRYSHVGDAEFLASWLVHPDFHLLAEWQ